MSNPDMLKKIDDFNSELTATIKKNEEDLKEQASVIQNLEYEKKTLENERESLCSYFKRKEEIMKTVNEKFREQYELLHQLKLDFESLNQKNNMSIHLESMRRREKFKELQINILEQCINDFEADLAYENKAFENNDKWKIYLLSGKNPMILTGLRRDVIMMEEANKNRKRELKEEENKLENLKKASDGFNIEEGKLKGQIWMKKQKMIKEEEIEKIQVEIKEEEEILSNLKAELDVVLNDSSNVELAFSHNTDELAILPIISEIELENIKNELKTLQTEKQLVPKLASKVEVLTLRVDQLRHKAEKMKRFHDHKYNEQFLMVQKSKDYMEKSVKLWTSYEKEMDKIKTHLAAKMEDVMIRKEKEYEDAVRFNEELVKTVEKLEMKEKVVAETEEITMDIDKENVKVQDVGIKRLNEVRDVKIEKSVNTEPSNIRDKSVINEDHKSVVCSTNDLVEKPNSESETKEKMCSIQ